MRYRSSAHFKFKSGDRVRVKGMKGLWRVHAPAPGTGMYWLKPSDSDPDAVAIAEIMRYRMITVHVSQLTPSPTTAPAANAPAPPETTPGAPSTGHSQLSGSRTTSHPPEGSQ